MYEYQRSDCRRIMVEVAGRVFECATRYMLKPREVNLREHAESCKFCRELLNGAIDEIGLVTASHLPAPADRRR